MRTWLYLSLGAILVAGAAFGLRQSGVDLVALTGLQQATKAASKPDDKNAGGKQSEAGRKKPDRGPSPVETARAKAADLSDDISAVGTLLAENSVDVAPETSGRVAAILFADGDTVQQGKELFRLDADLANADLAEAKARLDLAEANFARNQTLRKSGNIAQSTFDAVETERELARTAVESSSVRLRKLTITAPFSGTLGFRTISEGAYVTAGTPLVQLDQIDRLQVGFSVPELLQARIAPGQSVEVTGGDVGAMPDRQIAANDNRKGQNDPAAIGPEASKHGVMLLHNQRSPSCRWPCGRGGGNGRPTPCPD